MHKGWLVILVAVLALLMSASAKAVIIDNFDVGEQQVFSSNSTLHTDTLGSLPVFGGSRMVSLQRTAGGSFCFSEVDVDNSNKWAVSNNDGVVSWSSLTYTSGGATLFDDGGTASNTYFQARVITSDATNTLNVKLYTGAQFVEYTWSTLTAGSAINEQLSHFTGGTVDFTNITKIEVTLTGSNPSWDSSIDLLETTSHPDTGTVPEPSSMIVLLGLFGGAGLTRFVRRRPS